MSSRLLTCRRFGSAMVALVAAASSVAAGQLLMQKLERVVVVDDTPVFLMPDATRIPLRTLVGGSTLEVFSAEGPWLRVRFQDTQFGLRVGYVESTRVQRESAPVDVQPSTQATPPVATEGEGGKGASKDRSRADDTREASGRKRKKGR